MLKPYVAQLKSWAERDLGGRKFVDPEKLYRTMQVLDADSARGITRVRWTLWTRRNRYTISLVWREGDIPPYLGMGVSSRCWRAGEDWHRGNDLADGHFSEELWRQMLFDMIAYELDEPVPQQEFHPAGTASTKLDLPASSAASTSMQS